MNKHDSIYSKTKLNKATVAARLLSCLNRKGLFGLFKILFVFSIKAQNFCFNWSCHHGSVDPSDKKLADPRSNSELNFTSMYIAHLIPCLLSDCENRPNGGRDLHILKMVEIGH